MSETVPTGGAAPDALTVCDLEPIHVPGAIQPHGVLLAVDPDRRVVVQASANAAALFAAAGGGVLGRPLSDLLPPPALADLDPVFDGAPADDVGPFQAVVDGPDGPLVVDLTVSWSGPALVREVEAARHAFLVERVHAPRPVRRALRALEQAPTLEAMCDALADEVRELAGYDRVMVYRFSDAWDGEVVAEARRDDAEPFLGLRYPATDIPVQARALYRRNRLRIVADVDYAPVPVEPALSPLDGAPLDMSDGVLRSVSPVHVRYLQNMGVRATMTISLLHRGELWGLVACHHEIGRAHV